MKEIFKMKLLFLFTLIVPISGLHLHVGRTARSVNDGDVTAADEYLKKYGFMSSFNAFKSPTDVDKSRSESLKSFQRFHKLPVTGKLDAETIKEMNMPRCGVPDMTPTNNGIAQPFVLRQKWNKNSLTWKLSNFSPDLSQSVIRSEIIRALRLWSDVANLRFTEVTTGASVDIDISFRSGSHGDGAPFDGPSGTLAHAFFPPVGTTHFDEAETWVANRTGIDLFIVAAHEFGHALGLSHSDVRGALMFPTYAGYVPNYQLNADDIAGIRAHYGAAVAATIPPSTQAPTTTRRIEPPVVTTTRAPVVTTTRAPVVTTTRAPAVTPSRSPVVPTTQSTRPRICNIVFNAATMANDGRMLAFVARRYVMVMDDIDGLIRVARTNQLFRGAPRRPNAVFSVPTSGNVYFVRGNRVYEFNSEGRRIRMFWIRGARRTMPERPRAAFATSETDIYMLGSTKVWKFDLATRRVVENSHMMISEKFPGVPNNPDSAVMYDDATLYIFKGNGYYLFDIDFETVLYGPLDASSQFIKRWCQL